MALYAAAELDGLIHSGSAVEITTAGRFSTTYGIRAAVQVGGLITDYISAGTGLGSFATFWDRFRVWTTGSSTSGRTLKEYRNSSGTAVFRLQFTATDVLQAQYWNGSAWVNIGATYTVPQSLLYVADLKIVCGGSGSFEFYVGEVLQLSGSASMTSVTNIDEWRGYSTNSNAVNAAVFSEMIWGDEPTVGHRFCLGPPTGNGTHTAGSGAFGDVDEAVTNDGDSSTLAAAADAETYTHGAMTLPSGTVKAVMVNMRVKNAATGAQNVKARLRIGSTDYDQGSSYAGIGVGYTGYRARWATNPAGGDWTPTTAGQTSNEFGALAVA